MSGILAIDVGNTNTVVGLYLGDELEAHWRIETNGRRTADELGILLLRLLESQGYKGSQVTAAIASSVVPPAVYAIRRACRTYFGAELLVVGPGLKSGMPILYENPREVGADRVVNSVAAFEHFNAGCIAVDFGTATTWDVVTPKGEYLGGVIAPGIQISAEALYQQASKLPRVEFARPAKVIGRNTVSSMQSGMLFGYAGMVDTMVARIRQEAGFPLRCIATGGLAKFISQQSQEIELTDDLLTLKGLKIIYSRNQ